MKAMALEETADIASSPLVLREIPAPDPGQGEVRVQVRCCAICRTDLHVIEGELPREKSPIIPGHQIVGVVDKVGEGCSGIREGERVGVAWLRHTCGQCLLCARGQENLCESSRYTGYHVDGGYAEYAVAPEQFVYSIPGVFDDTDAAPLLCGGIIGYRALKRANVPDGGRLALYGFGSSAHVVMQIAKHRGYKVYVVSRGDGHLDLARAMNAEWAGHDATEMPEKADSAIIFAPVGHLVPTALEMLEKGGTLALAGIHMTDIPPLTYESHVFYERDIHSVTANTREDGRQLLEKAAEIPIRPRTTVYPLEDANRALQDLKNGTLIGTGILRIRE